MDFLEKRLRTWKNHVSLLGLTLISGKVRYTVDHYNHVKDVFDFEYNDTLDDCLSETADTDKKTDCYKCSDTEDEPGHHQQQLPNCEKIVRVRDNPLKHCLPRSPLHTFVIPNDRTDSISDSNFTGSDDQNDTQEIPRVRANEVDPRNSDIPVRIRRSSFWAVVDIPNPVLLAMMFPNELSESPCVGDTLPQSSAELKPMVTSREAIVLTTNTIYANKAGSQN